jgi:GWxTD domain-containing protein
MPCRRLTSGCAIAFVYLSLTSFPVLAQASKSNQTPDQKPRNVKRELKKAYQVWKQEDVALIVTPAELDAFDKLETDDEREQFIKMFWDRRDPDPDTEENEFKEEHYERLAYANEHFASGKPGSMTDRGRIYIKFGKPDEIESHPAGGPYQRATYEGGGSTTTYPFEKWFYRYIPGVRSGVEIEFVDPTGSGEYRLARDLDEKDAMLHVGPGNDPAEASNYRREQDSPFAIAELHKDLDKAPEIKPRSRGGTDLPVVDYDSLDFAVHPYFFRQSDNRVLTAFAIQTENKDLVFKDSGGLLTAHVNIFGRLTTLADRRAGSFEDAVTTTATAGELTNAKERKSAYAKAVILEPGRYRLDVVVRDIASGATGTKRIGLHVPRYEPNELATSSVVLATRLEDMSDLPTGGQFVIGTTKVIPNLSGVYQKGRPVGVYLQVYNAGIDQTTLRPAVDVEYTLLNGGKELGKQVEDWREINDSGQRLTLTKLIDSSKLMPGEYELVVRIRDRVTGKTLSPSAKFTVTQ